MPEPPTGHHLRPPPSLRRCLGARSGSGSLGMGIAETRKEDPSMGPDCVSNRPGAASEVITAERGFEGVPDRTPSRAEQSFASGQSLKLHRLPPVGSPGEGDHSIAFVFPGSTELVLHGALHAGSHGVLRALSQPQRRLIGVLCSPESFQRLGTRWNLKAGCGQFRTQRRLGRNRRG